MFISNTEDGKRFDKDFLFSMNFEPWPETDQRELFKYMSLDSMDKTCREDALYIRFSHIDNFEDKSEGSLIDVYYKKALKELKDEGILPANDYKKYEQIDVPKVMLMSETIGTITNYRRLPYEPYICCFSREKDNAHTIERDANGNNAGACLEFDDICFGDLNYGIDNNVELALVPVFYGDECIPELKKKITEIVRAEAGIPEEYIKDVLCSFRYCIKDKKCCDEKEIRLIIFANEEIYCDGVNLYKFSENGKKYIDARFKKHLLTDVIFREDSEETAQFYEKIRNRGYLTDCML